MSMHDESSYENCSDDDQCWRWFKRLGKFGPLAIVGMVLGGLVLGLLFAFLFGALVMWLWNWLMPEIFGLPQISYWQGWGLVLLSHILIKGGFGDHGGGGHKHKKSRRQRNGTVQTDGNATSFTLKADLAGKVDTETP